MTITRVGLPIVLFVLPVFSSEAGIDVREYFPLKTGTCWEFDGRVIAGGEKFKTKICVEPQEFFCGIRATPLLFTKNKASGYWGPGADLNLRWFIVNFEKRKLWPDRFLYAAGDERYRRDPKNWRARGEFDGSVSYVSKLLTIPAYAILPEHIFPPNSLPISNQYYGISKSQSPNCQLDGPTPIEAASWGVVYDRTAVATPAYRGDAIRIHFEENFNGRGWVERWYFADKIGPVQIETFVQGKKFSADNLPPIRHQLKLRRVFKEQIKTPPIAVR